MSYSRHWTTQVSPSMKSRTLNNRRSLSVMRCHAAQHRCHADQYSRTISPLARRVAAFPHNGNAKGTRPYTMNVAELFHGLSKQESHKPTYQRVRRVSLGIKAAMACAVYRVRPAEILSRSNAPDAQG